MNSLIKVMTEKLRLETGMNIWEHRELINSPQRNRKTAVYHFVVQQEIEGETLTIRFGPYREVEARLTIAMLLDMVNLGFLKIDPTAIPPVEAEETP